MNPTPLSLNSKPVYAERVEQGAAGFPDRNPLDVPDYSQVDTLGLRYKSGNFGVEERGLTCVQETERRGIEARERKQATSPSTSTYVCIHGD